jgi:23S rRNA pseudouridine1911/1915/1917 synthase
LTFTPAPTSFSSSIPFTSEIAEDGSVDYRLVVPEQAQGIRLDKWLSEQLLGERVSRQRVQELLLEGNVSVVGQASARNGHKLKVGQQVLVHLPPPSTLRFEPEDLNLNVVFEDEHLLIVEKPVGMLTHPTGVCQTGTLVNALLHHCKGRLSTINGVLRPGIVHRLDRDTQGLMVVARHDESHRKLAAALKARTIKRHYWAIAQGLPANPSGIVEAPIARHPQHRTKMQIHSEGRASRTHWQVQKTLANRFSWFACQLETGRTHQIRVHLAHIGHPLVGDPLYGTGLAELWGLELPGQLLQAYRLELTHPITGEPLAFENPPSEIMNNAWKGLEEKLYGQL